MFTRAAVVVGCVLIALGATIFLIIPESDLDRRVLLFTPMGGLVLVGSMLVLLGLMAKAFDKVEYYLATHAELEGADAVDQRARLPSITNADSVALLYGRRRTDLKE